MSILEQKDEWLIQRMVDGMLSIEGKNRFIKLLSTSSAARKFYSDLLRVHSALNNDSAKIVKTNFSTG